MKLRLRARFFVTGQAARVDVKHLNKLQKDLRRDRTLVALNQIEIAGRNTQRLGHRGLGEALLAAQTAHPRAGK